MSLEIGMKEVAISFLGTFVLSFALAVLLAPFAVLYGLVMFSMMILVTCSGMFLCLIMLLHQRTVSGYPIEVEICEKRGSSFIISKDRAKRIAIPEAGKFEYKLKVKNVRTKPIDWEYINIGARGQSYLKLFQSSPTEFHPMRYADFEKIVPISESSKIWYSEIVRRLFERWVHKGSMEKLAIPAMLVTVGVVIMIIIYVFVGQMSNIVGQVGGISTQLAETAKSFEKAADRFSGVVGSGAFIPPSVPAPQQNIPSPNNAIPIPPSPVT